jgi:hypothetical protein
MAQSETLDWETFEQKVRELRATHRKESSPLLFSEYYRLICASIGPEVKTFAGVDVPEYVPTVDTFRDLELLSLHKFPPVHQYRYMAYLRHFGFPSPLLDWSRSPFVATFFAFRDASVSDKPKKRSIYAYCESPKGVKGGAVGEPTIHPIGPYVQTHQRHFRQRCDVSVRRRPRRTPTTA